MLYKVYVSFEETAKSFEDIRKIYRCENGTIILIKTDNCEIAISPYNLEYIEVSEQE